MNFVRSSLSLRNVLGQRCGRVTNTWSHRGMCDKPQDVQSPPKPPAPAQAARFEVPNKFRPSKRDKQMLLSSGRFKSEDEIPEFVSPDMVDAARNKFRVKISYIMMALTFGGCLVMAFLGKRAAGRHESLISMNMERRDRWKEEVKEERETSAAAPTEKAQ